MIEQLENKIEWEELKDRHIQGRSSLGRIVIRMDRNESVTGVYTKFDSYWEKWVPDPGETVTESTGKGLAQTLLNTRLAADRLAGIAKTL